MVEWTNNLLKNFGEMQLGEGSLTWEEYSLTKNNQEVNNIEEEINNEYTKI